MDGKLLFGDGHLIRCLATLVAVELEISDAELQQADY
jgi:hypothetical protein